MITTVEDATAALRGRLRDYLSLKLDKDLNLKKPFSCIAHDDNGRPNMGFVEKASHELVHCFSCQATLNIFQAAELLDNLPSSGAAWVRETLPQLGKMLGVDIQLGELSLLDIQKLEQYRLCQDIEDILLGHYSKTANEYAESRGWSPNALPMNSIPEDVLVGQLMELGWTGSQINESLLVKTTNNRFFGEDRFTFVIRDERKRPCAFQSRNLTWVKGSGEKYLNSKDSIIYNKSKVLLGLDSALRYAKQDGLDIVEGPSDLATIRTVNVINSAAICGTGLTEYHLLLLKQLGIRKVTLCLNWDEAGVTSTKRILLGVFQNQVQIQFSVLEAPANGATDLNEFVTGGGDFNSLTRIHAFDWIIKNLASTETTEFLCEKLVPVIAAESTSVKREMFIKKLSEFTGITFSSILNDVNTIRNGKFQERKERLVAATDQFRREVEEDPGNLMGIMAAFESRVQKIEKEYSKNAIGVEYQVARLDALQTKMDSEDPNAMGFRMTWFQGFARAMSDGSPWHSDAYILVGGRPNSGKTATLWAIGTDIAYSDEDAILLAHSTDDSLLQIVPRIKASILRMRFPESRFPYGALVRPKLKLPFMDPEYRQQYKEADEIFRELVGTERLVLLDSEDGPNTSVLEKNLRHYRRLYNSKKIMVLADNTHNYQTGGEMDQTARMTSLANEFKALLPKYECACIASVEYRKGGARTLKEIVWPQDDDIADSRALSYRPNAIFHVYNDLNDRQDHADIAWMDEDGTLRPRLMLSFTKNKISSFKQKLALDLDTVSVTLREVDLDTVRVQAETVMEAKDSGGGLIKNESGTYNLITADAFEDD